MKITEIAQHQGKPVREAVLESASARVHVLNYGTVVRDWRVALPGEERSVVLGFEGFEAYPEHSKSFGILSGRVANRIAGGRFALDGVTHQLTQNQGQNHLHGGAIGLGRRLWEMEGDSASGRLHFRYLSPEGEEGYPGSVAFSVEMWLEGTRLTWRMEGRPDRPTPINLAQHNYYCLSAGSVREDRLWIDAVGFTPTDATLIPTGAVEDIAGTRYDFRTERPVGAEDAAREGHDINLMLRADRDQTQPAARATGADGALTLSVVTDQPALQLYDAPQMEIAVPGLGGRRYGPFSGLCLEAQHAPDSVNNPGWPSTIATPDRPYRQTLSVDIAPA